ncbi:uncharacterized protein LOC134826502 isoform X1 [Bolinopsis microptera]|uniref:uncharacterized protein LOC134826502 isoform X1 n=1 Tax=Bolinopsis microptera TaxID=2820187 RepID=UPI003079BDE2
MVKLLGTLQNITCNREDISELIANSTEYGDIPELVTNIFQTSSNVEVLESTIDCIYNMLQGSMALHEHFSNKQLIDTCISRIRSDVLSSEYKIKILRIIVTRLTCNHPAKVAALLVPHTHSLKEIAELDTDSKLSRLAAQLINTYLSCGEKRHKCVLVNTLFILNILKFFALYIVDIVLDIKVGINSVNDATLSTRYEGYCLLLFSILPLIYLNYQSVLRYYIQCWSRVTVDPVISLQGSNRGRIMKLFFPWRFDSVKHTILNILTVLQLHPLITAFELVFHRSKTLDTIISNKFHFGRLSTQEKILENVPCTLIKGIILYKFIDNNKSNVDFSLGSDEYVTLFSTVYGILTLCYKVASFEELCRSADNSPGALTTCQKLVSFIGVLLSLNSRLIMCLVLFSVMRDNGTMWIFTISVFLHILLSSVTHLLSHHEWQSPYDFSMVKRKFVIKDFILREGGNKNSKLVVIGRCALVFCLSWSESFIVSLRHPIDLVSGHFPSTYHLRSRRQFFLIYVFHLLEVITVTVLANTLNSKRWIMDLGYVSLALFLISGAMYMLYLTVLNPDKTSKLLSVSINPRLKQFGYKSQVTTSTRFCHVTEKATKINSTKVYSSNQYNYRLQVLDPCYDCMLGREHTDKDKPVSQSKCCSRSSFLKKLRNCFTRPFNSTYRRLSPSISDAENLAENLQLRRKDVDLLITKVRKYDNIHLHLLDLFPGIENIDPNLISRCRAIGSNVFRSIEDIRDDELSPNLVPACNKLKVRIENKYTDATEGDILNDELVEQISNLCEEYFSLKEQQWENKVLAWCETAPTEILTKYRFKKWGSAQCIKDIEKWITEKERLAVYLNPCNNNASYLPDTTIVLYDEKHSNFHINGVKTPSKHGWVTRKVAELRNCYHRNRRNSSSGQTKYQPVGQDIVAIETGQDIVAIETGQDIVNSAV